MRASWCALFSAGGTGNREDVPKPYFALVGRFEDTWPPHAGWIAYLAAGPGEHRSGVASLRECTCRASSFPNA
eukprot:CAMPEP_0174739758 /NCGR_PEP_ID=MMETSP1094-20130205/72142_1 /TAXON_ID=156173 /ORGANISM="Chrysochromulina brevifilum, Strain UTEX LB 985" /LENGTH=72 /DNA_ID=CAMNT_0015943349 /DNA_START=239 /DNA_END=457 /DNA_ORIENTATION=+